MHTSDKDERIPSDKWWHRLPSHLLYLREASTIYLDGPIDHKIRSFVDGITAGDLHVLESCYMKLRNPEHVHDLQRWLRQAGIEDQKFGVYWLLVCLIYIFRGN